MLWAVGLGLGFSFLFFCAFVIKNLELAKGQRKETSYRPCSRGLLMKGIFPFLRQIDLSLEAEPYIQLPDGRLPLGAHQGSHLNMAGLSLPPAPSSLPVPPLALTLINTSIPAFLKPRSPSELGRHHLSLTPRM